MGTSKSVMLCHGHHVVSGGAHMCVTSTANADDGVYYLALQFRARRLCTAEHQTHKAPSITPRAPLLCGPLLAHTAGRAHVPTRDTAHDRHARAVSRPYAHREGALEVTGPRLSTKREGAGGKKRGKNIRGWACAVIRRGVKQRCFHSVSTSICDGFTSA
ncbi:hypothetical protein LSM04_001737 [Trypanosoma melophagium]|uniref:uncharacterized protein n=1 Tax=Trypanosoma melophagium TaxID=715481 RepID=UPI003519DD7D|nr:hypothetical protein LSM04_001177 [Trypanosoma melophagium]KAH9598032.1 hypothetical protein LSM04_001737 [Trypanosoma melophagium]